MFSPLQQRFILRHQAPILSPDSFTTAPPDHIFIRTAMSSLSTSLHPATLSLNPQWDSDFKGLSITPHYTRQLPSDNGEQKVYLLHPKVIAEGIKNFSDAYQCDWDSRVGRNISGVTDEISKRIHESIDNSLQEWRGPDQETKMEHNGLGKPECAEIHLSEHNMLPSSIVVTNWPEERVEPLGSHINAMGLDRASVTAVEKMAESIHYISDVSRVRALLRGVRVRTIGDTSFRDVVLDPSFQSFFVNPTGTREYDPSVYCPPEMISKIYNNLKVFRRVLQGRMTSSPTEVARQLQLQHDINRSIKNSLNSQNAGNVPLTLETVLPSRLEAVHISSDIDAAPSLWLEHYPKSSVKPLETALRHMYPKDHIRVSTGLKSFMPSCVTHKDGFPILRLSVQGRYCSGNPAPKAYYLDPSSIKEVLKCFSNATVEAHDLPSMLEESDTLIKRMMQDKIRDSSWSSSNGLIEVPTDKLSTETRSVFLPASSLEYPLSRMAKDGNTAVELRELQILSYPESHIQELIENVGASAGNNGSADNHGVMG